LGKGKDPKRITHATVFVSKGSYQTLQTGVSPKHRAALIRSGERVSGHAAKQTQTKSAIRRLLENLSGVTDYEDRRQVEAARERAELSKSQFTRCRRDLRESANPFIKRGVTGNRICPSTDIDQINRAHLRMNKREHARYGRKVDYIPMKSRRPRDHPRLRTYS
jgi:hypothetical protein